MMPWLSSEIWPLVNALVLASLFGALTYAVMRWVERTWPLFSMVAILPLLGLYSLILENSTGISDYIVAAGTALVAVVGGYFHRRSGGASYSLGGAWIIMLFTLWICSISGELTLILVEINFFWPREAPVADIYLYALKVYPVLAPLALWIWQSLRIRPGVDEPLTDGRG